jgi:hypothetical protein
LIVFPTFKPCLLTNFLHKDDEWSCRFCTFSNNAGIVECMGCETPRKAISPNLNSSTSRPNSSTLSSGRLTIVIDEDDELINNVPEKSPTMPKNDSKDMSADLGFSDALKGAVVQCAACGCEFALEDLESLREHAALHISGSSNSFSVSSTPSTSVSSSSNSNDSISMNGINMKHFTTAYEYQYARSFCRAFKNVKTASQMQEHLDALSRELMIAADLETSDLNVIGALKEHYKNFPKIPRDFILATKVSHFYSGHGDRGWGCGYRNIQMMCSSLSELPHFKKSMFGGIGYIPTIPVLQQCLEAAWAAGFDPGAKERLHGVFGGNKWIGTYDAVSMLRYFGIHMELQTFTAKRRPGAASSSSSSSSNGNTSNIVSLSTFKYHRFQPAIYVPHTEMFKWVWNYFESCRARKDTVIAPLYLQHDGHSRTIIGAEKLNNRISLLLFDPSFPPRDICHQLLTNQSIPDVLRKTLSEFRHENYQIAFVKDSSAPIPQNRIAQFKNIKQQPGITS